MGVVSISLIREAEWPQVIGRKGFIIEIRHNAFWGAGAEVNRRLLLLQLLTVELR